MRIRAVSVAVVLGAALSLALLVWPQALGLERQPIFAHAVSLRALAAIAAGALAIGFAVLAMSARPVRLLASALAVLLIAFAGATTAVSLDRGTDNTELTDQSEDVTVLSWNTLGDAPGAAAIAELVWREDADIVSLPETSRGLGDEVAAMLHPDRPMTVLALDYGESTSRSTTLLVSAALGDYRIDEDAPATAVLPTLVAVPVDGTGPTIVAVHTLAPIPPMIAAWDADLRIVASMCTADSVILAGDFNATVDHFAGLGTLSGADLGRCSDAALAAGAAGLGTWPTWLPAPLGSPIDHVLTTPDWQVLAVRIGATDDSGSDHRPLVVQLDPPG